MRGVCCVCIAGCIGCTVAVGTECVIGCVVGCDGNGERAGTECVIGCVGCDGNGECGCVGACVSR